MAIRVLVRGLEDWIARNLLGCDRYDVVLNVFGELRGGGDYEREVRLTRDGPVVLERVAPARVFARVFLCCAGLVGARSVYRMRVTGDIQDSSDCEELEIDAQDWRGGLVESHCEWKNESSAEFAGGLAFVLYKKISLGSDAQTWQEVHAAQVEGLVRRTALGLLYPGEYRLEYDLHGEGLGALTIQVPEMRDAYVVDAEVFSAGTLRLMGLDAVLNSMERPRRVDVHIQALPEIPGGGSVKSLNVEEREIKIQPGSVAVEPCIVDSEGGWTYLKKAVCGIVAGAQGEVSCEVENRLAGSLEVIEDESTAGASWVLLEIRCLDSGEVRSGLLLREGVSMVWRDALSPGKWEVKCRDNLGRVGSCSFEVFSCRQDQLQHRFRPWGELVLESASGISADMGDLK